MKQEFTYKVLSVAFALSAFNNIYFNRYIHVYVYVYAHAYVYVCMFMTISFSATNIFPRMKSKILSRVQKFFSDLKFCLYYPNKIVMDKKGVRIRRWRTCTGN